MTITAGPIVPVTCYGTLSIAGVSMMTVTWCATDLSSLWDDPAVRGSDRLLPGVVGVKAYRRRATITAHSLPFVVTGATDPAGVASVLTVYAQLAVNLRYLKANVTTPVVAGDGTRSATLTLPNGTVITRAIHVLGLHGELRSGGIWTGTLDLSDPTGTFHAGG